jgi:hypothetical protein
MPQVGVAWLSGRVPPRARIVCAFPFWFVSVKISYLEGLGVDSACVVTPEGLLVPGQLYDGHIPRLLE